MKKSFIIQSVLTTVLFVFAVTAMLLAQERASPAATATGKVGDATITINYSSPGVKGRDIWGELVPYDKVWRSGANEPTTFETDKDLMIEGKELAAGKYSFFTIPGEKEWQIIFNSEIPRWGITRTGETTRNPDTDALVVTVKPKKSSEMNERLLYEVTSKGFSLKWENLEVPVAIK